MFYIFFLFFLSFTKTGVNPILQAAFTFAQMYFIFTYSRLMIIKFKLIARIGLMHLVATNICVWIRTLGKETLYVRAFAFLFYFFPKVLLSFSLVFVVRCVNLTYLLLQFFLLLLLFACRI